MPASIATVGIPIAAAGAFAAKTIGTALGSFASLINQANAPDEKTDESQITDTQVLKDKTERFLEQIASRIRNSDVPSDGKVEVQLDEFGLLRAYSNGQENLDLSRWLSGESDLSSAFSMIQTLSSELGQGDKLTLQVDLTRSS